MLYDKSSVLQVLGGYANNPSLFLDEKYKVTSEDFDERLHKIVFGAIKNLFYSGSMNIDAITIDSYLSSYPNQYAIFETNEGMNYIDNIKQFSKTENFNYNYYTLKKFTLLRTLRSKGIDVSDTYNEFVVDTKKQEEQRDEFDNTSINDIINVEGNENIKKCWIKIIRELKLREISYE